MKTKKIVEQISSTKEEKRKDSAIASPRVRQCVDTFATYPYSDHFPRAYISASGISGWIRVDVFSRIRKTRNL